MRSGDPRIRKAAVALVLAAAGAFPATGAGATQSLESGDVYARVDGAQVVLGNGVAERIWSRGPLRTTELLDKRAGGRRWAGSHRDFTLVLAGVSIGSESFSVRSVVLERLPSGGIRATMGLTGTGPAAGLTAQRVAEAYPGIPGFRTQTILTAAAPLPLASATLDEAGVGAVTPTLRAFRAGADWRDAGWPGPPLWPDVGGDFRKDRPAAAGAAVEGEAQWLDAGAGGRRLFMAMERNDLPSSRASYDGSTALLRVDYTKDVVDLGPFEEQIHVENPAAGGGRTRTLVPGQPFALEAAFVGFGTSADDEAAQWGRYLAEDRIARYPHAVTFNTNNVDSNAISTGAKDDANLKTIQELAPIARRLGVETFILDDGWQAASGDWYPDSPQHPEPRGKFPPRFPDGTFDAVRASIGPMALGLWMSPLHFNPAAQTFASHPQWACHPISDGLVLYNAAQPDDGSNEAGIGEWSTAGFPWVESRIEDAIDHWGVRYFKFDFMLWLDCAGQNDLYQDHDAFVAMIDRLRRAHPDVTFQIDETNDYRMFPFESTLRGPTWFQNGSPDPPALLHNLWILSPYVPAFAIGQEVLGGNQPWKRFDVNTLMAAALPSHITFWRDLRDLPDAVIQTAASWIDFYKAHRDSFSLPTLPLLDDPLKNGWTALQEWDAGAARGALLAFRQDSGDSTMRIPLRLVPPGLTFRLLEGPTGREVGTATSADLTRGLDVTLPDKGLAKVLLIEPVRPPPPPVTGPVGNPVKLPPATHCVDRRKFRFHLHHDRGARVVSVYVYVNGRRVLHRRGGNITTVALTRLPIGHFTVRIEAFQSNGAELISVRRYAGCRKSPPHTHRRHRHSHRRG